VPLYSNIAFTKLLYTIRRSLEREKKNSFRKFAEKVAACVIIGLPFH